MTNYYPIMLDIGNKDCLVIGGGRVAERKIESLLKHGAVVTVISPQVTDVIESFHLEKKVKLYKRPYENGDLKNFFLVYVATNDPYINEICSQEARRENVLINIVDKPKMCDFIVPASLKKGDLSISISTNGKSPMLSKKLREDIEKFIEDISEEYIEALGELRSKVMDEISDESNRRRLFESIVYNYPLNSFPKDKGIKEYLFSVYEKEKNK